MRSKFNIKRNDHTDPEPVPDILQNALYNDDYILSQAEVAAAEGILQSLNLWLEIFQMTRNEFNLRGGTSEFADDTLSFTLNEQSMSVSKDGYFKPCYKIGGSEIERRLLKMRLIAELYEPTILERIKNVNGLVEDVIHVHSSRGAAIVADASMEHGANLDEVARGALMKDMFMEMFYHDKE